MSIAEIPDTPHTPPAFDGAAEALIHDVYSQPGVAAERWELFLDSCDPATRIMFKTLLNVLAQADPTQKQQVATGFGLAFLFNDKLESGPKLDTLIFDAEPN